LGLFSAKEPDADAQRHRERRDARSIVHPLSDAFRHLHGHLTRGAGHDDGEFFAAVAGADVEDADAASQEIRNVAEGAVPFEVAEGVA